jgi:hypothetical protein
MNTVIEKVKTGAMKIKDLAIANPIVVGLLLVVLVLFLYSKIDIFKYSVYCL